MSEQYTESGFVVVKRMDVNLFEAVRDSITTICRNVRPTRHNGRLNFFGEQVTALFVKMKVSQKEYLEEVAIRSGRPYLTNLSYAQK